MNAFYEHHKGSIEFGYRCFDRILLNGLIQPFRWSPVKRRLMFTYYWPKRCEVWYLLCKD